MKNIYFLYKHNFLGYSILMFFIFFSGYLQAQEAPTITFQKPSEIKKEVKKEILDFENNKGKLTNTFNFQNASGIKKPNGATQKWIFDDSVFTIKRDTVIYGTNKLIGFNNSHSNYTISFKPDFSNNKIQRLQFRTQDAKELVYDAICKYPYLTINDAKVELELIVKNDSLVTKTLEIKNIGYENLNLKIIIPKNDIVSIGNTNHIIPPNSSKNIDFTFSYPKPSVVGDSKIANDTITQAIVIDFKNIDFSENTIAKEFEVTLITNKTVGRGFNYLYLLVVLLPFALLCLYLLVYKKSFIAYRKNLDAFYTKHQSENPKLVIAKSLEKFIPERKTLSDKKKHYYVDKIITFTQGRIFVEDSSEVFRTIKNEATKKDIITLFKSQEEAYCKHLNPKRKDDNTNMNNIIKPILKETLHASLDTISKGIKSNDFSRSTLDKTIAQGVANIIEAIKQENKENQLAVDFVKDIKSKTGYDSNEEVIKLLTDIYAICNTVKDKAIIKKLKNNISVSECVTFLEKDTTLIKRIEEIINHTKESGLTIDQAVKVLYEENKRLKQQIFSIPDEKLFISTFKAIFKIIDNIKNAPDWNNNFKNVFFRVLKDEESTLRILLAKYTDVAPKYITNEIPLETLKYTLSELLRIFAFSKVKASYVSDNFKQVNFPLQEYQANILILKGLMLRIYNVEIVFPELFNDIFNTKIHKKGHGASEVMRSAPDDMFYDIQDQTIIDFDTVVFKLSTATSGEKMKVFTK